MIFKKHTFFKSVHYPARYIEYCIGSKVKTVSEFQNVSMSHVNVLDDTMLSIIYESYVYH